MAIPGKRYWHLYWFRRTPNQEPMTGWHKEEVNSVTWNLGLQHAVCAQVESISSSLPLVSPPLVAVVVWMVDQFSLQFRCSWSGHRQYACQEGSLAPGCAYASAPRLALLHVKHTTKPCMSLVLHVCPIFIRYQKRPTCDRSCQAHLWECMWISLSKNERLHWKGKDVNQFLISDLLNAFWHFPSTNEDRLLGNCSFMLGPYVQVPVPFILAARMM